MTMMPSLLVPYLSPLLGLSAVGCAGLAWALLFKNRSWGLFGVGVVSLTCSLLLLLLYLMANHYTGVGVDESALFHLRKGAAGLTGQLLGPLVGLVCLCLLGGAILVAWAALRTRKAVQAKRQLPSWLILPFAGMALGFNPALIQLMDVLILNTHRHQYSQELEKLTHPAPVSPARHQPGSLPNVVLIYGEGLERSFFDDTRFPGLTPQINRLRQQAWDFSGIHQAPFTGWTIAGQVASQCGIPVTNPQNGSGVETQVCLGDILAQAGYTNVYLNASNLEFAGKGEFWEHHGYHRRLGYTDISALAGDPQAPLSEWGPYDDTLLKAAHNELNSLQQAGQPFILTLLTVDTHARKGYPTPSCSTLPFPLASRPEKRSAMLKAVHCSDQLLGQFIGQLLDRHDPNLIIVLMSDHIQPAVNDAEPFLPERDARQNLFLVWNGQPAKKIQRQATTFDLAPTLAQLLGWDVSAIGLGRSLLTPQPTLSEQLGSRPFFLRLQSAYTLDSEGFWKQDGRVFKTSRPPSG